MTTPQQADSPEAQRGVCQPEAERMGWTVRQEFLDAGITGHSIEKRPAFQRLMAACERGEFDVILVDRKDRLSRADPVEYMARVVFPLREAGVRVYTVKTGWLEWDNVAGQLLEVVSSHQASEENPITAGRLMGAMIKKWKDKVWTGGIAPFGYDTVEDDELVKRLVPHPVHAKILQWMFESVAGGQTAGWVVAKLKTQWKCPTPRGKELWSKTTVVNILKERTYLGLWIRNQHHQGNWATYEGGEVKISRTKTKYRRNPEADWIVVPDHVPRLVSDELFDKVQKALAENRTRTTPHVGGGTFVLGKLMRCGHCNSAMTATMQSGVGRTKVKKYCCSGHQQKGPLMCKRSNYVRESDVLAALLKKLREAMLNEDGVQGLLREAARIDEERADPSVAARLEARVKELTAKIDKGNENLALLPSDRLPGVIAKLREWEGERDAARKDLEALPTGSEVEKIQTELALVESRLYELEQAIHSGRTDDIRVLVRSMVKRVWLWWDQERMKKPNPPVRGVIVVGDAEEEFDLFSEAALPVSKADVSAPLARLLKGMIKDEAEGARNHEDYGKLMRSAEKTREVLAKVDLLPLEEGTPTRNLETSTRRCGC